MEWSRLTFLIFLCFAHVLKCKAQGQCQHPCTQQGSCIHQLYQNTCLYLFQRQQRTWQSNSEFCGHQGMEMVKMTPELMQTEQHPIFENQEYKSNGVWLAGKSRDLGGWKFLNSTSTDMLVRKSGLDGNDIGYCGYVISHNIRYGAGACGNIRSFLCRFDKNGRFGYVKVIKEEKTWFEARTHCIQAGGDLFYMKEGETEDEMREHIEKEIRYASSNDGRMLHVGIVHRLWQWNDGSQIHYTNWDTSEPNHGDETCLMMYGNSGLWNDLTCSSSKLTLCQKDAQNPTPSTRVISTPTPKTSNAISTPRVSTTTYSSPLSTGSKSSSGSNLGHMDEHPHEQTVNTESSTLVFDVDVKSGDTKTKQAMMLNIVLGTLLGVSFIVIGSGIIFALQKHLQSKKQTGTPAAYTYNNDNTYEVPTENDYVNENVNNYQNLSA